MSRVDRRAVVVAVVLLATGLQAGLAGVAFYGRRTAERELAAEVARSEAVAREIEATRQWQGQAQPTMPPRWQLLEGPDVPGTLQIVQGLGDAAGIELVGIRAAQSGSAGKQSFQITARGTPREAAVFLASIEQHARLIVVESGKVTPASATEVAFELGLATYHVGGGR